MTCLGRPFLGTKKRRRILKIPMQLLAKESLGRKSTMYEDVSGNSKF
jgi:hypothetical protein